MLGLLRGGQPWKKQEIQHLINDESDVSFHPVYLLVFLEKLGLSYTIPRTKRPSRPDNAEEILDGCGEIPIDQTKEEICSCLEATHE